MSAQTSKKEGEKKGGRCCHSSEVPTTHGCLSLAMSDGLLVLWLGGFRGLVRSLKALEEFTLLLKQLGVVFVILL